MKAAKQIGAAVSGGAEQFLIRVLAVRGGLTSGSSTPVLARTPDEVAWDLRLFTAEDEHVVEEFLSRAVTLKVAARQRLAAQLATRVAATIGAPEPTDPEPFLQRVVALHRSVTSP